MDTDNFEKLIKPFFWIEHENSVSVCLEAGDYKNELFQTRGDEGFGGDGYDWTSLAQLFLDTKMPTLADIIKFDPEAGMFCAYSSNVEALKTFVISFKEACENDDLLQDLFSKAELD